MKNFGKRDTHSNTEKNEIKIKKTIADFLVPKESSAFPSSATKKESPSKKGEQMSLNFGQKVFVTCAVCLIKYNVSVKEEQLFHRRMHKKYLKQKGSVDQLENISSTKSL
ncbi:hypothetical protein NEFER03_0513 [Nematocida sp. LUAm3]|nr:hypothetical protein NEFER03_0513 [Nematocida sp. LUAm3]KAI5175480.1 hypothetical protein NEFER02_1386 [Nematocida sp. LUAm2]KAI5178490.1 hypothetical protein NEFER01_1637 [Nematocida sp. LUAm1]